MANKIDREDMLALTRRMNVSRCSFTRIAGCYVDGDGDFDGSFNVNFLKLSAEYRAGKSSSFCGNQCESEAL